MTYLPEEWPIAAGMLQFPAVDHTGRVAQDASGEEWHRAFRTIARAGFDLAELPETWVRVADLDPARRFELLDAAAQAGIRIPSIAVIRRSIIDPVTGDENLRYGHRAIDAAAAMGIGTVSFGLHRPLTPEQASRLWFWSAPGPADDPADADAWRAAVAGFRELGDHAAELGIELSLEMYEDTYLGTADSAVRLVRDIARDNVGINPDLGNLVRLHRPIEDWRALVLAVAPYVNYWHIKNYFRDETPEGVIVTAPAPLELGFVDYRWAIQVVVEAGFSGTFVCEHYGGDGLSVAAANRDYIRRVLPEPGPTGYLPYRATQEHR